MQERLLPAIHGGPAIVEAIRRLTAAADVLDVPVIVTEQYPAGLGPTFAELRESLPNVPPVEKTRFSAACRPFLAAWRNWPARTSS